MTQPGRCILRRLRCQRPPDFRIICGACGFDQPSRGERLHRCVNCGRTIEVRNAV